MFDELEKQELEKQELEKQEIRRMIVKLFVVIIDRDQVKKIEELYNKERIRFHFICLAKGTASSEIVDLLGLGSPNKAVVISLLPDFRISDMEEKLMNKLYLYKAGKGIAFSIPLSGINSPIFKILDKEKHAHLELIKERTGMDVKEHFADIKMKMEKEVKEMKNLSKHDLIVSIINEGFSEELMEVAQEAGAAGGTILHGRRVNNEEVVKFLGISIQAEKEIVAILVPCEKTHDIMKAISKAVGMTTEAHGILFSLPADNVMGIQYKKTEEE